MPGFHFELSNLVVFALGVLCAAGAYYVRTEVAPATSGIKTIGDRLESLGRELMSKIDELKNALQAVNVTLGRSEERLGHNDRQIEKLDDRVTELERQFRSGA